MIEKEITICNKLGLHARAAAKFTRLASKFEADVFVCLNDKKVNAKSIMGLLMLAASNGTKLIVHTDGIDEDNAISEISTLVENKFDEKE